VQRWTVGIGFIVGGLTALAAAGAIALIYTQSGFFDVAASKPHTRIVAWVTHETMLHSVRRRAARIKAPAAFRAEQVASGFCLYDRHCVACHGAPAVGRQPWANGLLPGPPYLIDAPRQWSPAELFWITRHGIKMTGMPAWGETLSDPQVWNVVAFVEAMPRMPPQTYLRWRASGRCGGLSSSPAPGSPPIQRR
jgi:mono/diheme cytochrome c family protein